MNFSPEQWNSIPCASCGEMVETLGELDCNLNWHPYEDRVLCYDCFCALDEEEQREALEL